MNKVDSWSVAAGVFFVVLGTVLLLFSVFVWPLAVYGLISLILGIVILLTLKDQEYVEPIKSERIKTKKTRK
jgi:membrane-bound ClpP family serine protease